MRHFVTKITSVVALAVAGLIGCASTAPPPTPASETPTACAPRARVEVKLVSETGTGERVTGWSGDGAVLEPTAWITSADVERINIVQDPEHARRALSVRLREDARARLERLTGDHVGRRVAIVVAGRVAATLAVRDPVRGPALLVTGASEADVDSMTRAVCD
jgi:preprotein translocase subunit SecD